MSTLCEIYSTLEHKPATILYGRVHFTSLYAKANQRKYKRNKRKGEKNERKGKTNERKGKKNGSKKRQREENIIDSVSKFCYRVCSVECSASSIANFGGNLI